MAALTNCRNSLVSGRHDVYRASNRRPSAQPIDTDQPLQGSSAGRVAAAAADWRA